MTRPPSERAARRWRGGGALQRPIDLLDLLLAALCLGDAVAVLAGALARQVWIADVASLFRPYLVLVSVLVLVGCAATRRRWISGVALALCLLEVSLLALPILKGDAHPRGPRGGRTLTVITFNCLGSNPNSRTAVAWMRRMRPDILVLEELPDGWASELETLHNVLPYRASQLQDTHSDTDVFSRAPMLSAEAYRPAPDLRTLIHAKVSLDGRTVEVFGIHPNTLQTPLEWRDRNAALGLTAQWVAQTRGREAALVLGDWNTPPWSPYFNTFLKTAGLRSVDGVFWPAVTRVLAAPLGVRIGSPIDHVAATPGVGVLGCRTGPDLGSDHVPQICWVTLPPAT